MKNIDFRNGQPLIMMVSQYDYGYNLQLALWSNGTPVTITAAEIVSENFTTMCTFSGNVVTIPVTTSMTEQFGHFPAELRVTDSLGQVSSKNFDFFVERSPLAVKSTETYEGDIVEFTAKRVPLSSVVVMMEPIQDLNGYDHPWPAGGGKNKLPLTTSGIEAANPTRTWTNHSTTISGVTISIIEDDYGNVAGIKFNGTATASIQLFTTRSLSLVGDYILNGGVNNNLSVSVQAKGTSVGRDFRFTDDGTVRTSWIAVTNGATVDNVTVKPMIRLATDTDPTYEPYSNVCPITGRTGASVVVGENILPNIAKSVTRNGVTFTVGEDGTITANGTATATTVLILTNADNPVRITANQQYWLIGCPQGGSATTYELMLIQNFESGGGLAHDYGNGASYSVTQNVIRGVQIVIRNGYTANNLIFKPRFLSATTYPITFTSAGTVYAGTVDLVSGELVVTHRMVDLGSITWTRNTSEYSYAYFYSAGITNYAYGAMICSAYKFVGGGKAALTANGTISFYSSNSIRIVVRDDLYTDATEFKAAVNGVQCLYLLATPLTYNLTPTQVMSMLGENVVWSEDGEVTVVVPEYY